MTERIQRVTVITAHPDDSEFGAGATVAKLVREGKVVTYCILTNGNKGSSDRAMTPERLVAVSGLGIGGEHDLQGLVDAGGVFLDLILAQQLDDIEHGVPPSNAVAIKRLSARERQQLRSALEQVAQLDWLTRDMLFTA